MKKLAIMTAAALGPLAALCLISTKKFRRKKGKERGMERRMVLALVVTGMCAAPASGGYTFEGKWGSYGTGPGEFDGPAGVAVAPGGNVYVTNLYNNRIQYFTPTGSYLGEWYAPGFDVAVAANGNVYVTGPPKSIYYYTATGSLLGSFNGQGRPDFGRPGPLDFTPKGGFLVGDRATYYIHWFSPTRSLKYSWRTSFLRTPGGLVCSPFGEKVYISNSDRNCIMSFKYTGDLLASWGSRGKANGQFEYPMGLAITGDGTIFVTDTGNDRVQYFTSKGVFLGKWGSLGSGNGQFDMPCATAARRSGSRVYVADCDNHRIQYFNRNEPAVVPASLGRVKALFR